MAHTPTYRRPGLLLFSAAKNESLAIRPGGGNCRELLSNKAPIWSWYRRMVAVEATILGRVPRSVASRSTALSYKPINEPSGPVTRCSLVLDDKLRRQEPWDGNRRGRRG